MMASRRIPLLLCSGLLVASQPLLALPAHETLVAPMFASAEEVPDSTPRSDAQRSPTGEGWGTSTGTPTDMGPDNRMQIKDATRGGEPGVGLQGSERDTRPTASDSRSEDADHDQTQHSQP